MQSRGKYCCFCCPKEDKSEKSLMDICPDCGRAYGFPLIDIPVRIDRYTIERVLGRGFYSVTYLARTGKLNEPYVLKVTPKAICDYFHKQFDKECILHNEIAKGTEHVVKIRDYIMETEIQFGNLPLACNVAVLDFVDGKTFEDFLKEPNVKGRTAAQITIDLFRILREFANKQGYHNDLHSRNIMISRLDAKSQRAETEDGTIRVMAVDLGSFSDESKSNGEECRWEDQHQVVRHLHSLVSMLRRDIDKSADLDYRAAEAIEQLAWLLSPETTSQRRPTPDECIEIIHRDVSRSASPWKEQLILRRFDDTYNAQTLSPWFVPLLLVDPDDLWRSRISTRGPLVITGMRGCGKTMFLRALQFHARAVPEKNEAADRTLSRLKADAYVGLFVSCIRLLGKPGAMSEDPHLPFERLFIAYCLEALRAIRHLRELNERSVGTLYIQSLCQAIKRGISVPFNTAAIRTEHELEHALLDVQVGLSKGDNCCALTSHPSEAFGYLAESVKACSSLWSLSQVFYLLDDVSTRYIKDSTIQHIFSALLFQNPVCAFKMTTEAQTLEKNLLSPGEIEKARQGRDYEVFDLGTEVYKKTRKGRKQFITSILTRRAAYYPSHPQAAPDAFLGDISLESVAERIVSTSETSAEKKGVYHGITALSAVCVGDIGDVISLYEMILRKASGKDYPIAAIIQSESYQDFCSRRLYEVNRRESDLKDYALGFAEASHELLVRSHKEIRDAKAKGAINESINIPRLRQYCKVYVRVTTGDTGKQFERIRRLLDAGVFVFDGGVPRTKTRDGDPIQQFKLTYRKLFGLSNYIGLAERDRFELSGKDLEDWLTVPKLGKSILLRNLGRTEEDDEPEGANETEEQTAAAIVSPDAVGLEVPPLPAQSQLSLFPKVVGDVFKNGSDGLEDRLARLEHNPLAVRSITDQQLIEAGIASVILGLGFEDRTLASIIRLMERTRPNQALLIRYPELGKTKEIKAALVGCGAEIDIIDYRNIALKGLRVPPGPVLVDVTGLAKPAIYHGVRDALRRDGVIWVCHTRAKKYYPLDADIERIVEAEKQHDYYTLLEALTHIFSGEKGPYKMNALMDSNADPSRRRVLCTFASPKHQRLLSLLDERDYDRMELVVPPKTTFRNEIANIAAGIAQGSYYGTGLHEIDSDDLAQTLAFLVERYRYWYVNRSFNFEFGLIGSKIQGVACAALSAAFKVSQAWYVSPKKFDAKRFTEGVGSTTYYEISLSYDAPIPGTFRCAPGPA